MGVEEEEYSAGQMTYDLRRLRLKGIIYRAPGTTRYYLTPYGWKVCVFGRMVFRVPSLIPQWFSI